MNNKLSKEIQQIKDIDIDRQNKKRLMWYNHSTLRNAFLKTLRDNFLEEGMYSTEVVKWDKDHRGVFQQEFANA